MILGAVQGSKNGEISAFYFMSISFYAGLKWFLRCHLFPSWSDDKGKLGKGEKP